MEQNNSIRLLLLVLAMSITLMVGACTFASSSSSDDSDAVPTSTQENEAVGVPEADDSENIEADVPEVEADDTAEPESEIEPEGSDTDDAARVNEEVIEEEVVPGNPVELRIDTIDAAASFEYVGLTEDGDMGAPEDWDNVSWYESGATPGDQGNAAIAGHYDSPTGEAVFYRLKELENGDHVTIITDQGEELVFEVIELERFHINDAPLDKIFGRTDERNMNLITCDGVWDSEADTYEERLVVYTRLVEG